jgi:ABC-type cobalamin/Fe3+-siderophores transport system ATPase subunit
MQRNQKGHRGGSPEEVIQSGMIAYIYGLQAEIITHLHCASCVPIFR